MFVLADTSTDALTAQALAFMSAAFGTIVIVVLAVTVFFVWMFWRVFAKAGFSGALGLLCLIPSIGPLICLIILAFSTWPNERTASPVQPSTGVA
jgi:heme/copper-type cytochrome/quinol oxidase subunit 2